MSQPTADTGRLPELGRIKPPYMFDLCANEDCDDRVLGEERGVYMFRDLHSDKIIFVCGTCGTWFELEHRDRFLLIAL
jgi:hypothetical protein